MSPEEAKSKFESLRKQYRDILKYEAKKNKSGAAREDTPKWALYDSMEFIRDYESIDE